MFDKIPMQLEFYSQTEQHIPSAIEVEKPQIKGLEQL